MTPKTRSDALLGSLSVGDFFTLLIFGPFLAWMLLPRFWGRIVAWLLEHSLLVPASQAAVSIPGSEAGLDVRRLVVASAVLLVLVVLLRPRRRERGESRS